ncbi:PTS sugar transporter subunit IIA [Propionispora vibrioides]|uniref:PTS system, mannose-specific IIA component n=1 Tax=Propionispora vibrioides TaxID=112903 RepID=A0A1H8SIZ9_9FIRM|nr:PTS sugar transporter subunit IIA [Propionispora vibrioides]SEO78258.1 PTS system, mannose-specific IIA component [Propionispora vibrioides]
MKIIVVSHGSFAKGLLESAQMIIGKQENVVAFGLYPTDSTHTLRNLLEEEMKNSEDKEEFLFLTDLFHGSPFNVVVSLMKDYPIYHITGINLPLFIEIMNKRTLLKGEELCAEIMKSAKDSISDVKNYLKEVM